MYGDRFFTDAQALFRSLVSRGNNVDLPLASRLYNLASREANGRMIATPHVETAWQHINPRLRGEVVARGLVG